MNGFFEKPANLIELARMICGLEWCDQWKYKLADADNSQLLTKKQFYRMGAV